MSGVLTRPDAIFGPGRGLLRTEHFQMAYATNDLEQAMTLFKDRFGIREFRRLDGPLAAGGEVHVALAWVGTIMYELITASGPGSAIYVDRLPAGDFVLKHHHLGFLIPDQAQWDVLMDEVERGGWSMPHLSINANFMSSCFIDVPELGHYFEYLFPDSAGLAFFENVPGN